MYFPIHRSLTGDFALRLYYWVLILRLLEYGWFDRAMRYLPLVRLLEGDLAIESAESPSNILVDLSPVLALLGTVSCTAAVLFFIASF